jgi:voltage-gated potassium channel
MPTRKSSSASYGRPRTRVRADSLHSRPFNEQASPDCAESAVTAPAVRFVRGEPGGAPNISPMEGQPPRQLGHRLQSRVDRKGLRPRLAVFVIVVAWGVGVVVFSVVERIVDPGTFDTIWLAVWWAIQTVTTVGYGDVVPGSTAGKVIAGFMMLGGLALFAVVTGAITSAFVSQAQRQRSADPVIQRLDEITAELGELKADVARLGGSAD